MNANTITYTEPPCEKGEFVFEWKALNPPARCILDYTPTEETKWTLYSDYCTLRSVSIRGVDITHILSRDQIKSLEVEARDMVRKQYRESWDEALIANAYESTFLRRRFA